MNFNRGFSLIEIALVAGILGSMISILVTEVFLGYQSSNTAGNLTRATFLAQEGLEAVKNIRDNRYFDLQDGTFDAVTSNGSWSLQSYVAAPSEGSQQRKITITTSGSGSDQRKEITSATIQWKNGQPVTLVSLVTRFANWLPTKVDWTVPKSGGSFDLTSHDPNCGSNKHSSTSVRVSGNYLYVGSANSNCKEFITLSIADTPNLSTVGSLDLSGSPQKMDVGGNYVYVASDSNAQELQVIDVSNKNAPFLAGSFNLTNANSGDDNSDANSIAVWGNYVFLGRKIDPQSNFFVFDVGNNAGCLPTSPCLISQLQIADAAKPGGYDPRDIKLSSNGNYAYVVVDHGKFFRINVSNKNNPYIDGAAVSMHDGDGASLVITSTRAYVGLEGVTGTAGSCGAKDEIYIINIANPTSTNPSCISSFNLGDNSDDVENVSFAADDQALIILSATKAKDFQVLNVSNDMVPVLLGTLNLSDTVHESDWSDTYHSEYIVGQVSNAEIQIVVPNLKL